jgi:V8-like Glu-specific endopeptidase
MSFQLRSIIALLALAPLAACLAPVSDSDEQINEENVGRGDRAIIGGSKATAYPESVLISMKKNGALQAYCSGSLIAPQVVLTAGHCVYGFNGWDVTAPYASNQKASSTSGVTYDWKNTNETVDPNTHDVGLIFLSKAITLTTYPTLSDKALANGSQVVNIGRINNGSLSTTNLYVSKPLTVNNAASYGYPFDYIASEVIESGDSGGPDMAVGTHTIVAVNSGGGGGTEVLARVDLLYSWIQSQVASHGGSGGSTGGGSTGGGSTGGTNTCSHALCSTGTKLTSSCDSCVQTICTQDSYCCNTKWDSQCVSEVASMCGQSTCSSGGGSTGGGTTPPAPTDPCGGVTYAGQCNSNTVVWCENSSLKQINCSSGGKSCGYDSAHGYYNCL